MRKMVELLALITTINRKQTATQMPAPSVGIFWPRYWLIFIQPYNNSSTSSCNPVSFYNSRLDPCTGVTCGTGLTATSTLGVCQCLCGTSLCDLSISNTCDNGICKCGGDTSCDSTSNNPSCLTSSSTTPDWGDSTATCKVNFVNNFLRMVKTF